MGRLKTKADIQKKNKKGTMQNFIQNCIVPIFYFLILKLPKLFSVLCNCSVR